MIKFDTAYAKARNLAKNKLAGSRLEDQAKLDMNSQVFKSTTFKALSQIVNVECGNGYDATMQKQDNGVLSMNRTTSLKALCETKYYNVVNSASCSV